MVFFRGRQTWRELAVLTAAAGLLSACSNAPPRQTASVAPAPAATQTTVRADPSTWIGRWKGTGVRRLDVISLPGADRYELVFRNDQGITVTHDATASGGYLYYDGAEQHLALRPGTGAETGVAAQRALSACLIIVPGNIGYCRDPGTADALALAHGAFVPVRQPCDAAVPDDVLLFDGRRLYRPNSAKCATRIVSQQGMRFDLADPCLSDADNPGGNITLDTPTTHDLAITGSNGTTRLYRYCASNRLIPALRRIAPQ